MNSCCTLLWLHHLYGCLVGLYTEANVQTTITWSCGLTATVILLITHTPNLQYVPILCLRAYITFSCQITQSYFQPTLFAVMRCCCSCGPVRRSFSLDSLNSVNGLYLCTEYRTCNGVAGMHSGSGHRVLKAFDPFLCQSSKVPE